MNLNESVALVTGANRGLGTRLVQELLRAGAANEETVVFPDDASAGAGAVYRQDPLKLEQLLLAS
jgi:NAD(P)-dependent dehydrogenase (short-subunit alcohol dehydrogenase family)